MDWQAFCEKIEKLLRGYGSRISINYDAERIQFEVFNQVGIYTIDEYMVLAHNAKKFSFQPYAIIGESVYESLVDFPDMDSRRRFAINYEDKLQSLSIIDNENGLNYSFTKPSSELIWFLISEYDNRRIFNRYPISIMERKCDNIEKIDLFSLLEIYLRLPLSLYVKSKDTINKDKIVKFAKSFLFNLAYNLDFVFKSLTDMNEIFPQRPVINKRRINNINEITAPQLAYNQELTEQYYMALASNDPYIKFIGYYHIMEYFYEEVYNEDIFTNVQKIIQHPGFSSKRKKDVAKIIEIIKKKIRQSKEEFQGSEIEALELTIRKFVNIGELSIDVIEFNELLIDYYKTHQVNFSEGDTFDLRDTLNDKLPTRIAARIYKTRNALVHSKSNDGRVSERGIYKPFKDNQVLTMEIPLMKFIAETIIINSATSF